MVIVDEAARAGIDVLIPMTLGRSVVLVGDHRQLPPHVNRELEAQLEQGIRERVDIQRESLFSWLWRRLPRANVVSLSREYRMHENIGRAISRLFYEPELPLSHHFSDERARERLPYFDLCSNEPLVWIDTSDVLQDPGLRAQEGLPSWPCGESNELEVRLITKLIGRISPELLSREPRVPEKLIGVIAFYKQQVALLEERLRAELRPEVFARVQLGTVDSFQGREFPLVLLSTVRSNAKGFVGFLCLPNRVNVAMSRAQRQLVVLGDSRTLAAQGERGSVELRQLYQELQSGRLRGSIRRSLEVVQ